MTRVPPFIEPLSSEPEFKTQVADIFRSVYGEADALDLKTKYLIGLALDIAFGSAPGTRNIAQMARDQGATEAEILSVIRICFGAAGFQRLITGLAALDRSGQTTPAGDGS